MLFFGLLQKRRNSLLLLLLFVSVRDEIALELLFFWREGKARLCYVILHGGIKSFDLVIFQGNGKFLYIIYCSKYSTVEGT